jgi:glycosyltransferase involved in cell wall biosynthesis
MSGSATLRRAAGLPGAATRALVARARTVRWAPRSRLFAVGDGGAWSVDEDAEHVEQAARRLGLEVGPAAWAAHARRQAVFLTSQFTALRPPWPGSSHALGLAYYHGRPGTPGHPEFDRYFGLLQAQRSRFAAVQVTHGEMDELVRAAGVEPDAVFRIPLGIDIGSFPLGDGAGRLASRDRFRLPRDAYVVGSFQKDGVGWAEGLQPKLVKGPDVLVEALTTLHARVPELVVLLLGPSRGFVREGLARAGVRFVHARAGARAELAAAYHALDAYVVPSRQEGGPKGALEAMAAGAPLVSTRVGQVPDIVADGASGFLVEPGDAAALANALATVAALAGDTRDAVRTAARTTAEQHALERLDPLWKPLFARLLTDGDGA